MTVISAIGANALFLLYAWLASSIIASYLSDKKGYGEKPGLASGLLLSVAAIVVWLLIPAKADSAWTRRKAARGGKAPAGKTPAGKTPAAGGKADAPD
jgi:hypothetical protein